MHPMVCLLIHDLQIFQGFSQRSPMRSLATRPILASMTSMYSNDRVDPGPGPGLPRRWSPRSRAAALIVTCAVLAGGAFAVTDAASGPSAPAATAAVRTAPLPAAGATGQAAVLNGALADASLASSVASGTSGPLSKADRVALRRLRRALVRLRRLGGMYGQYTFETKKGPRTLAFERGTITAVNGAGVVVRAADGTTWTWVLAGASVVRRGGARTRSSALAAGQPVFAGGMVRGTARDARLIVI